MRIWFFRLLRTVKTTRRQYLALAAVVMVAMSLLYGLGATCVSLGQTLADFESVSGMASETFILRGMPAKEAEKLLAIPGVEAVQSRMVLDVTAVLPDGQMTGLRLFSWTGSGTVCRPVMVSGRDTAGDNEVLMPPVFASTVKLKPGDTLKLSNGGRQREVLISGTATEMDLTTTARRPNAFFESDVFAPALAPDALIESLSGTSGWVSEVLIRYVADENTGAGEAVMTALTPWGVISRTGEAQHPVLRNHALWKQVMRSVAVVFPLVFMLCAMAFLFMLLRQMIRGQRREIGILKALGCSDRFVASFYAAYGLAVALPGSLAGILLGMVFYRLLMNQYRVSLSLPWLHGAVNLWLMLGGVLLCGVVGVAAGFLSARGLSQISPAIAMNRPDDGPARASGATHVMLRWMPESWKMTLRSIRRNPMRFTLTTAGLMASVMLLYASFWFNDSRVALSDRYFGNEIQYTHVLWLQSPQPQAAVMKILGDTEGVTRAEPVLAAVVTLTSVQSEVSEVLTGVLPDASLNRITGTEGRILHATGQGILLSQAMAEQLGVSAGDSVRMKVQAFSGEKTITVRVDDICSHSMIRTSYCDISLLQQWTGAGGMADGYYLNTESHSAGAAIAGNIPGTLFVRDVKDIRTQARVVLSGVTLAAAIITGCALAMTLALVYQTSVMSMTERRRELAVLCVLGYSFQQVSRLMRQELVLQLLLSLLPGLWAGRQLGGFFIRMISTPDMVYPSHFRLLSLLIATGILTMAGVAAHGLAMLNVRRIRLAEATRARE